MYSENGNMKTVVHMKRPLFGMEITQKSDNEFFSATDLIKAGNLWRLNNDLDPFKMSSFLNSGSTK